MKKSILHRVLVSILILSMILGSFSAFAQDDVAVKTIAAASGDPYASILDDNVKTLIKDAIVVYDSFYEAIVNGHRVKLVEGDTNIVAEANGTQDLYVPVDFAKNNIAENADNAEDTMTKSGIKYVSVLEAAQMSGYTTYKKDCIILLSKDDSLGGLFDKHYQSV